MANSGDTIWILKIDTESSDHYLYAFANKPSNREIFEFLKTMGDDFRADEIGEYFEDLDLNWGSNCYCSLIEEKLI